MKFLWCAGGWHAKYFDCVYYHLSRTFCLIFDNIFCFISERMSVYQDHGVQPHGVKPASIRFWPERLLLPHFYLFTDVTNMTHRKKNYQTILGYRKMRRAIISNLVEGAMGYLKSAETYGVLKSTLVDRVKK